MSGLSAFFQENVEQPKNVKFVASKRFKDSKGKPMEWEIRAISSQENEELKRQATKRVQVNGKKNQYMPELDTGKYQTLVCAKCTVFPNLNDVELQNSWGAMCAEELLTKMLLAGELTEYSQKVLEINGFAMEDDLIEEAKN